MNRAFPLRGGGKMEWLAYRQPVSLVFSTASATAGRQLFNSLVVLLDLAYSLTSGLNLELNLPCFFLLLLNFPQSLYKF